MQGLDRGIVCDIAGTRGDGAAGGSTNPRRQGQQRAWTGSTGDVATAIPAVLTATPARVPTASSCPHQARERTR